MMFCDLGEGMWGRERHAVLDLWLPKTRQTEGVWKFHGCVNPVKVKPI